MLTSSLFQNQLRELEEKYKAAMVTNAQLDNVKTSNIFQIDLLKEQIEEQEEAILEIQRLYKDKCRVSINNQERIWFLIQFYSALRQYGQKCMFVTLCN